MSYERPDRLDGTITKVSMPCGSLWVIIGRDTRGYPRELFLEGSKAGTCRANLEGQARAISELLKLGEYDRAIECLEGIRCASCMRKIGSLPKEEKQDCPFSCSDAASRELVKISEEAKEKK